MFFNIRRGDLRSPAGEHSSPLPSVIKFLGKDIMLFEYIFNIRRGDLRSPAGEHSSPLPSLIKFLGKDITLFRYVFLMFQIKWLSQMHCANEKAVFFMNYASSTTQPS